MSTKNVSQIADSILKTSSFAEAKRILDGFDKNLQLECDGFTRVAGYILDQQHVPYRAYVGHVRWNKKEFQPHWWIVSQGKIIDYRLRMWFGPGAPHGIFPIRDYNSGEFKNDQMNVIYKGLPTNVKINSIIFSVLTGEIG